MLFFSLSIINDSFIENVVTMTTTGSRIATDLLGSAGTGGSYSTISRLFKDGAGDLQPRGPGFNIDVIDNDGEVISFLKLATARYTTAERSEDVVYEKSNEATSTSGSTSYSTRRSRVEYEVLTRVDEFCRVDGAKFDFVHISCRAEYGKWYIGIIPR